MSIARYENIVINNVTNGVDIVGEQTTTITKWFETKARVKQVHNSLKISEKYRVYSDLINFTVNFTPWTRRMVDEQPLYSITWRGYDWRITECFETDDRMNVIFMCYRNDPISPV